MNPLLATLQPYPFEKLRRLLAGVSPNRAYAPINLSIGEPRHATPQFIKASLAGALDGLSTYLPTAGLPGLRAAITAWRTYHGSAMSLAVQRASIAAWADEAHVRDNRRLCAAKFAAVLPLLAAPFAAYAPEGGFYLWLRTPIDDCEFTFALQREYNVLVLPGSYLSREAHGETPGRGYVRIALVAPLAECVEAAGRIAEFAARL